MAKKRVDPDDLKTVRGIRISNNQVKILEKVGGSMQLGFNKLMEAAKKKVDKVRKRGEK